MGGFGWMWNKAKTQLNVSRNVASSSSPPPFGTANNARRLSCSFDTTGPSPSRWRKQSTCSWITATAFVPRSGFRCGYSGVWILVEICWTVSRSPPYSPCTWSLTRLQVYACSLICALRSNILHSSSRRQRLDSNRNSGPRVNVNAHPSYQLGGSGCLHPIKDIPTRRHVQPERLWRPIRPVLKSE